MTLINNICDHKSIYTRIIITFKSKWYRRKDTMNVCLSCFEWTVKNYSELIKKVKLVDI